MTTDSSQHARDGVPTAAPLGTAEPPESVRRVPAAGHGHAPVGPITVHVPDLARRRGRVPASWVFTPVWLLWSGSLLWSLGLNIARVPDEAPFVAALYVCAGFFIHSYTIAWRTSSLWRAPAWLVSIALLAVLGLWHVDAAAARVVYPLDSVQTRVPEPRLIGSAVCHSLIGAAMTAHLFFLGLGSRAASPKEMAQHLRRGGQIRGTALTRPLPPMTVPAADADAEPPTTGVKHVEEQP